MGQTAKEMIQQRRSGGMGTYAPRETGYGMVQPGASSGNVAGDVARQMGNEIKGYLGFPHTQGVEESFKDRGRRAYLKGQGI